MMVRNLTRIMILLSESDETDPRVPAQELNFPFHKALMRKLIAEQQSSDATLSKVLLAGSNSQHQTFLSRV